MTVNEAIRYIDDYLYNVGCDDPMLEKAFITLVDFAKLSRYRMLGIANDAYEVKNKDAAKEL